jgi:hypothetical protein
MLWGEGKSSALDIPAGAEYNTGALAKSVFVSNGDVYVAGHDAGSGNGMRPLLWKNGVPQRIDYWDRDTPLNHGYTEGVATSVFVAGDDVYVAGQGNYKRVNGALTGGQTVLVWKNGIMTEQAKGIGANAYAHSIFVSGNDVYIAGYEYTWDDSGLGFWATIWKNGIPQALGDKGYYIDSDYRDYRNEARNVFVSNSDVYVVGHELNADNKSVAKLWKNGTAQNITNGNSHAFAYSVYASGVDVYVAGEEFDAQGASRARLWKNGAAQTLAGNGATAYSVYVSGNDVYVAGGDASGNALLWKNGTAQTLGRGIGVSVFVK